MISRVYITFLLPVLTLAPPPPSELSTSNWGEEKWHWVVGEYPNPITNPRGCNRYHPSFVCDPDGILEMEQANELDSIIQKIQNNTMCICRDCLQNDGMKFAVAILRKMKLTYHDRLLDVSKAFAEELRRNWSIDGCQDDVLIFVAVTEKQIYVDTGKASGRMLPQEAMDKIFLDHKHQFSSGNYYQGLYGMLDDYYTLLLRLQHEPHRGTPTHVDTAGAPAGLIAGIVVGVIFLIAVIIGTVFIQQRKQSLCPESKEIKSGNHSIFNFRKERPPRPFFVGNPSPAVYQPCQTSSVPEDEGKNTEDEDLEEVSPETLLTAEEASPETLLTAEEAKEEEQNTNSATLPLEPHVEIRPIDDDKIDDETSSSKVDT